MRRGVCVPQVVLVALQDEIRPREDQRLVLENHVPNFVTVCLPVWFRDRYGAVKPCLHLEGLEHEQGFSQVAVCVPGNFADNVVIVYPEILARGDVLHHFHHLRTLRSV